MTCKCQRDRQAYRETTSRMFADANRPERILLRRVYRLSKRSSDSVFIARAETFIAGLYLEQARWLRERP